VLFCERSARRHARVDTELGDEEMSQWLNRRSAARLELLDFAPGNWEEPSNLIHYCFMGCSCRHRDDAVAKLCQLLQDGFLNVRPPIPACNRWNKVFAPMSWWMFASCFHGIVSNCILQVRDMDAAQASSVGAVVDVVGGPETEAIYRLKKQIRRRTG